LVPVPCLDRLPYAVLCRSLEIGGCPNGERALIKHHLQMLEALCSSPAAKSCAGAGATALVAALADAKAPESTCNVVECVPQAYKGTKSITDSSSSSSSSAGATKADKNQLTPVPMYLLSVNDEFERFSGYSREE
jgi:hypothetical protein